MALAASYLADFLRQTGRLTTTQARKSFTAFAVITPGLLMIAQIFFGMDRVFAVVIFTLQLLFNGAVTAGYLGNGLDIAPNFSGKYCFFRLKILNLVHRLSHLNTVVLQFNMESAQC